MAAMKKIVNVEQCFNRDYSSNMSEPDKYVYLVKSLKNTTCLTIGSYLTSSQVGILITNGTEVNISQTK